jgi:hypothetical protein
MAMDKINGNCYWQNQKRILGSARVSYFRIRKLLQCYKNSAKTNKTLVKTLARDLAGLQKQLDETHY